MFCEMSRRIDSLSERELLTDTYCFRRCLLVEHVKVKITRNNYILNASVNSKCFRVLNRREVKSVRTGRSVE